MFSTPHNLANVPAELLEEEQIRRAMERTSRNIGRAFRAIEVMSRKNLARHWEIEKLRVRRQKQGGAA
jgi:ActR/RegA family two-component response regulator